jgi:hypothetical protein
MPVAIGERRSERILLDLPLIVRPAESKAQDFQEETFTIVVNAHGALIMLESRVAMGQNLVLMNPKNWDERRVRVVYVGPFYAGMAKVGVEFTEPSPEFWPIDSPPTNWNVSRSH